MFGLVLKCIFDTLKILRLVLVAYHAHAMDRPCIFTSLKRKEYILTQEINDVQFKFLSNEIHI